jgi:tRNA (guanosine-2'-O-)-methyltransferase
MRGPQQPSIGQRDLPSPVGVHPLDHLMTASRAQKYRQVLARRTEKLIVVVEDCYDPHNATAIVRTCDAFGLQRVVVTTGRNAFRVNRKISQGSHLYVDLAVYPDIEQAYAALRKENYRIMVTDLSADSVSSPNLLRPMLAEQPLAIVFGNEGSGVTPAASQLADGHFLIPMIGFPQSLNLSVSVAATLWSLRGDALTADNPGDLSPERQQQLYDKWIRTHKGEVADAAMRHLSAQPEIGKHGEELDRFEG